MDAENNPGSQHKKWQAQMMERLFTFDHIEYWDELAKSKGKIQPMSWFERRKKLEGVLILHIDEASESQKKTHAKL